MIMADNSERPKRQRGKPKRYHSDDNVNNDSDTSDGGGDEQDGKVRIRIRMPPTASSVAPTAAGRVKRAHVASKPSPGAAMKRKRRGGRKKCIYPGCGKLSRKAGLCRRHGHGAQAGDTRRLSDREGAAAVTGSTSQDNEEEGGGREDTPDSETMTHDSKEAEASEASDEEEAPSDGETTDQQEETETDENSAEEDEASRKGDQDFAATGVNPPSMEVTGRESVTKVRIRVARRLREGYREALLPHDEGGSARTATAGVATPNRKTNNMIAVADMLEKQVKKNENEEDTELERIVPAITPEEEAKEDNNSEEKEEESDDIREVTESSVADNSSLNGTSKVEVETCSAAAASDNNADDCVDHELDNSYEPLSDKNDNNNQKDEITGDAIAGCDSGRKSHANEVNSQNDLRSITSDENPPSMREKGDVGNENPGLRNHTCGAMLPLASPDKEEEAGPTKKIATNQSKVFEENENAMVDTVYKGGNGDEKLHNNKVNEESKNQEVTKATAAKVDEPPPSAAKKLVLDFEVAAVAQRKANGAFLCLAVGCSKVAQTQSEGFCRAHHNRFLIGTGRCESREPIFMLLPSFLSSIYSFAFTR